MKYRSVLQYEEYWREFFEREVVSESQATHVIPASTEVKNADVPSDVDAFAIPTTSTSEIDLSESSVVNSTEEPSEVRLIDLQLFAQLYHMLYF